MFCPTINDECVGEKCRDWDKEKGQCVIQEQKSMPQLLQGYMIQYQQDIKRLTDMFGDIVESSKLSRIWDKITVTRMLSDPTIPDDVKEVIQKAFEAPSSDVAEKLLRDTGLI